MTAEIKKKPRKVSRAGSRKGKFLNAAEKAEAITLWKSGSVTLEQLAEKFDRSKLTFIRLFNAQGVAKGESSAETTRKVVEAVEAATAGDIAEIAQRVRETKEDHYKMSQGLAKLVWNLIVTCKKENRAFLTIAGDLKALRYASAILRDTRAEKYAILGLDEERDEGDKEPEDLVIREVSLEEIQERIKSQVGSDDDLAIADLGEIPGEDLP